MKLTARRRLNSQNEDKDLLLRIRRVCRERDYWQQEFQRAVEEPLVDCCIYRQMALESEYRYLLELARRRGLTFAYVPDPMEALSPAFSS